MSGADYYGGGADTGNNEESTTIYLDAPGQIGAVTYKVQCTTPQLGGMVINGLGSDIASQTYAMRSRSSLTLIEVKFEIFLHERCSGGLDPRAPTPGTARHAGWAPRRPRAASLPRRGT